MENITFCNELYNNFTCQKGMWFPLISEYQWALWVRILIYGVGLLWSFFGVAIIADVFMCSIEKITSKTRLINVANPDAKDGVEQIEVKVWNDTVANLTLMALGSSAPEILLSCIEIMGRGFQSGELGPSTIVGSAAFNLFVITAVCIFSIPEGEIRTIKYIKVFAVTAVFSVFAYLWLIVILVASSRNYVDIWEAAVTLLFFPLMVVIAYIADKDFCGRKPKQQAVEIGFSDSPKPLVDDEGHIDKDGMTAFLKELGKHPELKEEDAARMAAAKVSEQQHHSRLWYRINATRGLAGGNKLVPSMNDQLVELYEQIKSREHERKEMGSSETLAMVDMSGVAKNKAIVEFTATACAVMENEKRVRLGIRRYGRTDNQVMVKVETVEGTAEPVKDYVPVKTTIVFEPNENYKYIDIEIIDDNEWEPDEQFFVKLAIDPQNDVILGKKSINTVTIINDDEPGTLEFAKPSLLFKESAGKAMIPVQRNNGADGRISVSWKTEDMTAINGKDYEGGEGTITFEHGETTKMIEITIIDDQDTEKDECFKIELCDPTAGSQLGRIKKTIITIVNDDEFNGMVSRLVNLTNMNVDSLRVGTATWQDQFRNAMNVNGGDVDSATSVDYLLHFLTFGFKVIFACVPPATIFGGWLAFVCALGMITILTIIIGDLASVFGCLITCPDSVTAITFVALGTSLPDLFASKQAATNEPTADNSIGNITGSNSVNVFLGLGLPWTIAAIYHSANGGAFEVKAGTLVFSVVIYSVFALCCIGLILLRRYVGMFGGELGGNKCWKIVSAIFLCMLWVLYVLVSTLQATSVISNPFQV